MSEKVVYLHGRPSPIGHFLRVGTAGHRQLEARARSELAKG